MWMSSPGRCAFVAHGRRLGIEGGEAAEAEPAQHGADGGARQGRASRAMAGPLRRCRRSARSPRRRRGRRAMRASAGRRLAVVKRRRAARPMPRQPLVGRALRNAGRLGGIGNAPASSPHATHQKGSTMHRHAGILMDVHPGLRLRVGWSRNPNLAAQPRMNNLHSFDI